MKMPPLSRREFITLSSAAAAGAVSGCATNPVSGRPQFMLMSAAQEVAVDRQRSPHQFSSDYGPVQDAALNSYIAGIGGKMASLSHRADVPYSFRAVNASYANAYAFPGGSIAVTRGILLNIEDEAELSALLGHELGHVNARHTAQRMTKGLVTSALLAGVVAVVAQEDERYTDLAAGLGGVGAGLLLAKYSRANEREADDLGMDYMVRAGYDPQGMVGLMDILRSLSKRRPGAVEQMFSSHPMSDERYQTAVQAAAERRQAATSRATHRDRYMDHTAGIRKIGGAIEAMQQGDEAMMARRPKRARAHYATALKQAPQDYAALLSTAKCLLALEQPGEAMPYVQQAKAAYPGEAQAHHISGMLNLDAKRFPAAHADFSRYKQLLPGNPNTVFLNGFSLENMRRTEEAAGEYKTFLRAVSEGRYAQHAYRRLVEWGYAR